MIGDTGTKVPGLGVIVFRDGREVYSNFLGQAVIDEKDPSKSKPFARDSRFRIASVSKMFTIFTIMQLVEQGKLDLDADVSRYLGFELRNPKYPQQPITIRMLASHTSSLRDDKIYSIPPQMSLQEFFKPTGEFYVNGGHFAPDTIALQNPYDEDYQMTYSLKGYVPGTNATVFSPAGGLRISCEELSHALEMLMNNGTYRGRQILSPESVQAMFNREWIYDEAKKNGSSYGGTLLSYGLGIYQMDGNTTARFSRDTEIDLAGHTGEAFGLLSMLALRPGTKDGFVYIMNGEAVEEDEDEMWQF